MDRRKLQQLLEGAGVGWAVSGRSDDAFTLVERDIQELDGFLDAKKRVSRTLRHYAPKGLFHYILANSQKMKPLIQTLVAPLSTEIRAMVFFLLTGSKVAEVSYRFKRLKRSALKITVTLPDGIDMSFSSREIWDCDVLRHFGLMKANDAPVIEGYHSFTFE